MLRHAQRFLLVLIVFALVGAPSAQLAQSAGYTAPITMANMPCDQMTPAADTGQGTPMTPCKGLTPGCVKQMGCIVNVALPTKLVGTQTALSFAKVDYWSALAQPAGVASQPDPQPPRTI